MTTRLPPPPTPPGWYPDPGGGGKRYWDGNQCTTYRTNDSPMPPGTYAPPLGMRAKKRRRWPWIVLGVVVVLVLIGHFSGGGNNTQTQSSTSTAPAQTTTRAAPSVSGIGQEARDGKFAFTVTSVNTAKTVGDPSNEFMQKTAQGVYVVVSMTVKNIGKQSQSYFGDNQKLKEGTGREFSADSEADLWMNEGIQTDINPGNQVYVRVAFDVPSGTQPSEIELHDSMFSGGVTVKLS